jgi:hypothetical protein
VASPTIQKIADMILVRASVEIRGITEDESNALLLATNVKYA